MPVLDNPQPEQKDVPQPQFPEEQKPPEQPRPSALDVAGAAERSTLTGSLVQNIENFGDQPSMAAQPGYNPIDHIPAGFLHDYGHEYVHLDSPEQVAAKTAEIQERIANQQIIARAGKWGTAASFAAGTVDPINIASMAIVP